MLEVMSLGLSANARLRFANVLCDHTIMLQKRWGPGESSNVFNTLAVHHAAYLVFKNGQ